MWITRYALPFAIVLATLIACFAPKASAPVKEFSARALLGRIQQASGANYTYDQSTARVLERTQVPCPPKTEGREELEARLEDAGFSLRPVGKAENAVFRVEPTAR